MKIKYHFFALITGSLIMASPGQLQAQFLKNILNTVKNTATQNIDNKAGEVTNKAIDKIEGVGKTKNNSSSNTNTTAPPPTTTSSANPTTQGATTGQPSDNNTQAQNSNTGSNETNNAPPQKDPFSSDGSFITLKVFPKKVILRNSVSISGASVKYQDLNKVVMTITAENKFSQSKDISLKDDGTFATTWQPGSDGDYTIQVKSSDGKAFQSEDISVYELKEMDSVTQKPKDETKKAFNNLNNSIDAITPKLSSKDASDLKKEMGKVTRRKNAYLDFLNSMEEAAKKLDALEKQQGPLPPTVVTNFGRVTDTILHTADEMEQANNIASHKSYDNTICEYLVMVKEECAAFTTITSFECKTIAGILKNITLKNVIAGIAGAENDNAGVSGDVKNINIQCTKIAAIAESSAEKMNDELKSGSGDFATDLINMCSEHFLDKYCVVLSGDLSENYRCVVRNKNQKPWWDYKYSTAATISLRSPKNSISGGVMKMKGNIEGNATDFSIYQNVKEIDEFKEEMQGKDGFVDVFPICVNAPTHIPFSSTKADKNTEFGAVARAIVTPAYFNIPIDADYDLNNKKLTLYVNDAIVDFTSMVCYNYIYMAVAAGIPIFTRVNYPINKVRLTLGKVISDNSTFKVGGTEEKPSIKGTAETHLGDGSTHIEQRININFLMKGE